MPEETVLALVLRRRNSGESDRRLTLFTREQGKIEVIAKGARKANSRLAGSSEPLNLVTMSIAKGKLNLFLTQAQPHTSFPNLRGDYKRLTMGLAYAELVNALTTADQLDEALFDLMVGTIRQLDTHPKPLVALVWGQLKLLAIEGATPLWTTCAVTGKTLSDNPAWISASAGGYVSAGSESGFRDRFKGSAEMLIGLDRCAELDEPPSNLKHGVECAQALLPFFRQIAHAALPANESLAQSLCEETGNSC